MSNIDKITSTSNYSVVGQEQLFTELTAEEGAVIKGGADFSFVNPLDIDVYYTLNGFPNRPNEKLLVLHPHQEVKYPLPQVVKYDNKIVRDYNPVVVNLAEGINNFYLNGDNLTLTAGIATT